MLKTTHITKFLFQKADYYLSNEKGNELLLKVNYKNNTYLVKNLSVVNPDLNEEAKKIAKNLLVRKHNVNFAEAERAK